VKHEFDCSVCGEHKTHESDISTGYAKYPDGSLVCFDCCADLDRKAMKQDGHSKRLPLYLSPGDDGKWRVMNWPGTLRFPVKRLKRGSHNIAGSRYDVWFNGPDGHEWYGVNYGEDSQVCHCRRTKALSA